MHKESDLKRLIQLLIIVETVVLVVVALQSSMDVMIKICNTTWICQIFEIQQQSHGNYNTFERINTMTNRRLSHGVGNAKCTPYTTHPD